MEEYPNRLRKAAALKRCVEVLERLKEKYTPIFSDDPMIVGYLAQMKADIAVLEALTPEEKAFRPPVLTVKEK